MKASCALIEEPFALPIYRDGECIRSWQILDVMKSTGRSTIYEVKDSRGQTRVLKVCAPYRNYGLPTTHEASIMCLLPDHPGLPRLYDSWKEAGCAHLVMDHAGQELSRYLRLRGLTLADARSILLKILEIVEYLHEEVGVTHLDLKPGNCLVDESGQFHLIDFGLSQRLDTPASERWQPKIPNTIVGTPGYISPEMIEGAHNDLDERADIYAVGAIGYQLLTGNIPKPPEAFFPFSVPIDEKNPNPLSVCINTALCWDREERYQTAHEFIHALYQL